MDQDHNASRRGLLKAGAAALAAVAGVAATARAQDEKLAQSVVQYQTQPKDGQQCNKCVNWVEPNQCKIVQGTIAPAGWCVAFAPKEG